VRIRLLPLTIEQVRDKFIFWAPEIPPHTDAYGPRFVRGLYQTVAEQEARREAHEIIEVSGRLWGFWNVLVSNRPFFRPIYHILQKLFPRPYHGNSGTGAKSADFGERLRPAHHRERVLPMPMPATEHERSWHSRDSRSRAEQ
jgi:hypothetical protein